ncbi:MAG: esterase-like activity of phytase family protein [bacterium]|nr:esterase-like activity of phytase family protein [bacterium]
MSRVLLRSRRLFLLLAACLIATVGPPTTASALAVVDPGQTPVVISGAGNAEFSGIAHTGGGQFLSVADSGGTLHPVSISIDPVTGFVSQASAGTPVILAGGVDLEGVAWRSATGSVFVSDEVGPAIREVDPTTGALIRNVTLPPIFANLRPNLGLESLSLAPDGSALWTANEAALLVDGPVANFVDGTWVRIQRFDGTGTAAGQWAYRTEAQGSFSGVVDLVALPSGELLVLERALALGGFQSRLFLIDFNGATDTSSLPALAGASFQGVGKTLLWSRLGGALNIEGMGLGPTLANGDTSLVLVSDGGGTSPPNTLALRLSVPEPGILLLVLLGTAGMLGRSRAAFASQLGKFHRNPSRSEATCEALQLDLIRSGG